MSSATVCNCPQNTPDPACPQAESSRQSGQQQKMPDIRTGTEPVSWSEQGGPKKRTPNTLQSTHNLVKYSQILKILSPTHSPGNLQNDIMTCKTGSLTTTVTVPGMGEVESSRSR